MLSAVPFSDFPVVTLLSGMSPFRQIHQKSLPEGDAMWLIEKPYFAKRFEFSFEARSEIFKLSDDGFEVFGRQSQ